MKHPCHFPTPSQACRDFLGLAQTHSKRWQKALQAERDQRVRLEETLEQLAKQHNHLERAFRGATVLPSSLSNSAMDNKGRALTICTSSCIAVLVILFQNNSDKLPQLVHFSSMYFWGGDLQMNSLKYVCTYYRKKRL